MARIKSANNLAIEQAILAIGRAHIRIPRIDPLRAKELAVKIDGQMASYKTGECTIALCIQLLRTLGVEAPADLSRFLSH